MRRTPVEARVIVVGAVIAVLGAATAAVTDSFDEIIWPLAVGGLIVMMVGAIMLMRKRPE
jgi:hypothetical protein